LVLPKAKDNSDICWKKFLGARFQLSQPLEPFIQDLSVITNDLELADRVRALTLESLYQVNLVRFATIKNSAFAEFSIVSFCGERGIRTPGPVTVNGFQDRRIRPLCHLSGANIDSGFLSAKFILLFSKFFVA
jgi:hypothetical protein